jgi:hypothetical protein
MGVRDSLAVARLDGPAPLVEERPLPSHRWERVLALDATGGRAAVLRGSEVVVLDTATGAQTAVLSVAARLAVFGEDGTLRVWTGGSGPGDDLVALDCDLTRGTRVERVRVPSRGRAVWADPGDALGRTLITRWQGGTNAETWSTLTDSVTGNTVAVPGPSTLPRVLQDGTLAVGVGTELRLLDRTGSVVRTVPLEVKVEGVTEPFPGQLAVQTSDFRSLPWWRTTIVDARTGSVLRRTAGFRNVGAGYGPPPAAGSPGARLVVGNGGLSRLEPDGSVKVIVPAQE